MLKSSVIHNYTGEIVAEVSHLFCTYQKHGNKWRNIFKYLSSITFAIWPNLLHPTPCIEYKQQIWQLNYKLEHGTCLYSAFMSYMGVHFHGNVHALH